MIQNLQTAHWEHSQKKAELIVDKKVLIEIKFSRKAAVVKFGKDRYEIRRDGFWCPRIIIKQKDAEVTTQKQLGLWGTKSEFLIDNDTYIAKTKQGTLFNITYSTNNIDILTYKLDGSNNKPKITFEVKKYRSS